MGEVRPSSTCRLDYLTIKYICDLISGNKICDLAICDFSCLRGVPISAFLLLVVAIETIYKSYIQYIHVQGVKAEVDMSVGVHVDIRKPVCEASCMQGKG